MSRLLSKKLHFLSFWDLSRNTPCIFTVKTVGDLYQHVDESLQSPWSPLSDALFPSVCIYARLSVCPSLRYDDGYISETLDSTKDLFLKFILIFRIIRDVYSIYFFK